VCSRPRAWNLHDLGWRAVLFDVFGTLVDWRAGVAREAERILQPLGHGLDWLAFADAWRDEYQPAMEEVRAGQIPFCKLDLLHRRNLDRILPRFGISGLGEDAARELNLGWHRLDAWPDAPRGLARLKRRFVLAPVSNGNISLMVDLARRNRCSAQRPRATTSQNRAYISPPARLSICPRDPA
jgi:2-haloacid dehalogenase